MKTQYTLAYLENEMKLSVLFVDNINVLARFNPRRHAVVVFDDIDMRKLKREDLIRLVDKDVDRTAKILYQTVALPAITGRVIIANFHPEVLWNKWDDKYVNSVRRRLNIVEVTEPLVKHGTDSISIEE
jgi:hypothetical protein